MKQLPKDYTLETERFVLRIPKKSDIPRIFSASRYDGFNDGMGWDAPDDISVLEKAFVHTIDAWESGAGYSFTIANQDNDELVGRISIRKTKKSDVWNVGFWTHPTCYNQGVMTEALEAIIGLAFSFLDARRVEGAHAIWNKASGRVMEKNGMIFQEYLERGFLKRGAWVPENLLAIDKEDWNS